MKIITTLLALILSASFACAADREDKKTEDTKSGEQEKLGPRDRAKQQEEMFKQMDANSDGKVSKEEFNAKQGGDKAAGGAADRFSKLDRNNDGELTKREFTTPTYERGGDRPRGEGDKPGPKKPGEGDKPGEKKPEAK